MSDLQQQRRELARCFAEAEGLDKPLDEKLAHYVARSREVMPDVLAAYDRLVAQVEGATAGGSVPVVGEVLPPFALPDNKSHIVHLDDLVARGDVILSFNRGHWCPYCRLELRSLARAAPILQERAAEVVSIVPETGEHRDRMIADSGLPFLVLSDVDLGYTLSLGLVMAVNAEVIEVYRLLGIDLPRFQGREGWFLPIPATYVVDSNRRIKAGFVNPDFRKRMTIEQIEAALRA